MFKLMIFDKSKKYFFLISHKNNNNDKTVKKDKTLQDQSKRN